MECIAQLNQMNFAPTEKGKTMAENYKHLYEQTKKMLAMYQDELVPGFRKQIEEMEAKNKWIPVSERLPDIGGCYLVAVKYKYDLEKEYNYDTDVATYNFGYGYIDGKWDTYVDWDEGQQYIHVTHWMLLPEPPKEEK